MQLGGTLLSPEERERRRVEGLCFYCGRTGHYRNTCPHRGTRGQPLTVSTLLCPNISSHQCLLSVTIIGGKGRVTVPALVDSGSAGNFISRRLVQHLQLATSPCSPPLPITAINNQPLGSGLISQATVPVTLVVGVLHSERLSLLVIDDITNEVILGLPWLAFHKPQIAWTNNELLRWSDKCASQCLVKPIRAATIRSPAAAAPPGVPSVYLDLAAVFSKTSAECLPPHRPGDCAIDLMSGATLPRGRIFPLSLPESQAMENYVEEALAKGFIRPSTSPAASSFFFVKKDGGLRPCIDYRGLNATTIKYRYPLPLVPAAVEQLREAQVYTKLDLRSAYNLIRIRDGDEWKTAFHTATGHYEYLVMPFGLANAPSVFQAFVNEVLREYIGKCVIVYIDDILVYSTDLEKHVAHVRQVLEKLLENHLYVKLEKCEFHKTQVQFLGYVISSQGVQMDKDKIKAVVDWPGPQTVKELQRFLGFANFYRRFIRNFSSVAAPLTSLLKGSPKKLVWNEAAARAFRELKDRFTSAPVLKHPDPNLPFVVEVDTSETGVGGILSQRHGKPAKLHPCAFFSRKLTSAERNYDVGNRELLAVKLAFEEWRHWLEGTKHPFVVLTDHRNLEYIQSAKRLNPRQARWALFFTRFDFTLTYRPGSKNGKADALSRLHDTVTSQNTPGPILPTQHIIAPIRWDIMGQIQQALPGDPVPPGCPGDRTYVPSAVRAQLLHWVHSSPSSGHPGVQRTLSLTREQFWWPSLVRDVTNYVTACAVCAQTRSSRQLPSGLLEPLPIPNRPWSHMAVDFITDLPRSQGFTTILVAVDRFSKACRLIPLKGLPTALETAEALFHHVFRTFGLPEEIVSDRGVQFTSKVWAAFF
uniref:Gypsy retrotransposon integrase-like protein 1 n=1 Tax=Gasterosteus aculeatus aculeatus TaxID=481459 RepID=A0AAQ4PQG4_GASAC